ncbi:MAG: hypothetical protein KID00_10060 [Clostridium argentinense]|nr:hypothetical protein [Clostridium argentinense]
MKSCNKKVIIAIVTLFFISILTFVSFKKAAFNVAFDKNISHSKDKVLHTFFKLDKNATFYYSGTLEHVEKININSIENNNNQTIVNLSSKILPTNDVNLDKSKLNIQFSYIFYGDSVRQIIKNSNDIHSQSIIKDSEILKSPLVVDNSWSEKFNYKSKEYIASTKITNIGENPEGKKIVETETTVNNIEGFVNNTYRELKTYTEGVGLTSFTRTLPNFGDNQTPGFDFAKELFKIE